MVLPTKSACAPTLQHEPLFPTINTLAAMGAVASSSLLAGPTCTWALSTCLALALCYVLAKLPTFISRVRVWNYYCSSHTSWYNVSGTAPCRSCQT